MNHLSCQEEHGSNFEVVAVTKDSLRPGIFWASAAFIIVQYMYTGRCFQLKNSLGKSLSPALGTSFSSSNLVPRSLFFICRAFLPPCCSGGGELGKEEGEEKHFLRAVGNRGKKEVEG